MGALLSLWGGRRHVDPPVEGALPVLDAGALLRPHRSRLAAIRQLVGVPRAHWEAFYATVFEAYAGFVQQLPASEAHHHAGPGGMLAHGLEVVREALTNPPGADLDARSAPAGSAPGKARIKLRRGRLLPPGAAAEELAARQDLWTYATATGALLHDLGKPVTDQRVRFYDRQGRELGYWDPWAGPLPAVAGWYRVEFVRERRYRFHERVPPLLVRFILPQRGLSWLASDPEVFAAWLATLSGDTDQAGVLGELVHRADGLSVASDLAGVPARMPSARRTKSPGAILDSGAQRRWPDWGVGQDARRKPLVARLRTGLRYLLDQGTLPLNRPGAAGWRLDDDLWLVSKRVLDALREHLRQEGQESVPTRNDRLMDELQQDGLLTPNGDRAVWTVQVTTGDWSQQLTVLRFPVQTLWPDPDARPPVFDGSVVPVGENRDDTTSEDPKTTPGPEPSPPDADDASEAPVEAAPPEPRKSGMGRRPDGTQGLVDDHPRIRKMDPGCGPECRIQSGGTLEQRLHRG